MRDWLYIWLPDIWVHPETKVRIFGEDMPWELKPARPGGLRERLDALPQGG